MLNSLLSIKKLDGFFRQISRSMNFYPKAIYSVVPRVWEDIASVTILKQWTIEYITIKVNDILNHGDVVIIDTLKICKRLWLSSIAEVSTLPERRYMLFSLGSTHEYLYE